MKAIVVFILLSVMGCQVLPPYVTTTKTFIVFENQTHSPVNVINKSNHNARESFTLLPEVTDFVYEYEAESVKSPLPNWISKLEIEVNECKFELANTDLEQAFKRNYKTHNSWWLTIDNAFLMQRGCKETHN